MITRRLKLILPLAAIAMALGAASTARAHGFGDRYDLPVPLSFFAVGSGAAVVLSFAIIGIVVDVEKGALRYPRFDLFQAKRSRFLMGKLAVWLVRLVSVFLFFLLLAAAFFGDVNPVSNLAPTFIWVIWWVGMGFFVALFGNLWALVNPWKILYGWAESIHQLARPGKQLGLGPAVSRGSRQMAQRGPFFCASHGWRAHSVAVRTRGTWGS